MLVAWREVDEEEGRRRKQEEQCDGRNLSCREVAMGGIGGVRSLDIGVSSRARISIPSSCSSLTFATSKAH